MTVHRSPHILCTILLFLVVTPFISTCQNEKSQDTNEEQPKGRTLEYTREVSFLNMSGELITTIEVAVADDDSERSSGLMDVNNLPSNKGMLFIFDDEQPRSFWMANTPLALDIIFINEELEIVRIHQNTQPFAEKNFQSENPAKYVVEVNGGFSISHDIQQGMKVRF